MRQPKAVAAGATSETVTEDDDEDEDEGPQCEEKRKIIRRWSKGNKEGF